MIARSRKPLHGWLLGLALVASVGTVTPAFGAGSAGLGTTEAIIGSLQSVAGASKSDAWGVGSRWTGTEDRTLIEHWDGSTWSTVPSPSPGGANGSYLSGITVVSATDAWAVGQYFANADLTDVRTLIVHWDGTSWTQVKSPSPAGFVNLSQVSAASTSDAWAVGVQRTATNTTNLVLHWDGKRWSRVPNQLPGGPEQLFGVSAVSAKDVWAVGYYDNGTQTYEGLIEHWDGKRWTVVNSPSPGPNGANVKGISAVSADDAWAVGSYSKGRSAKIKTLTEHWDGKRWSIVASPSPSGDATLSAVSAVAADDAWAVGSYIYGPDNYSKTLIVHWDGHAWSRVASPNPGGNDRLLGVGAVSATNAWVVGDTYDQSVWRTLNENWDGTVWKAR